MASSEKKPDYQPIVTDLRKDMTLPVGGAEAAQAASDTTQQQAAAQPKDQEKKFVTHKGVLQLFKEYKGDKGPKELIALFAEAAIPGFAQEPPIALTDGKTTVRLKLQLKPTGGEPPRFLMQGASVKELTGDAETGSWVVDVLPKQGAFEAMLTVVDGPVLTDYPLTVAPKVDPLLTKGQKLTEADFAMFLAKPAKYDLNKDEKFDATDEYIYAANYIVAMKIKPEKLKKEQPPEAAKPAAKEDGKPKEAPKKGEEPKKEPEQPPKPSEPQAPNKQ
jgi:hypothetical protein